MSTPGLKPETKRVTYEAFVMDNSGSMWNIIEAIRKMYNDQIDNLIEESKDPETGEIYVSLYYFGSTVRPIFVNMPVEKLAHLKKGEYLSDGGMTAMRDGIGQAITDLKKMTGDNVAYKVTTLTDGQTNSDREWTQEALAKQIETLQATGNWTFVTLGTEIDLTVVNAQTGTYAANTMAFDKDASGVAAMSRGLTASNKSFYKSRKLDVTASMAFFEPQPDDAETTPS